jgi:hypothetical protein
MLKKILIAALLLPLLAFGQSFPSPTFNNLTVNGTFTASGKVTLASLAAQAANTVVANATGSSASPTAVSVPNCAGTSSALTYTGGSGFNCNATINALTLGGATFAAPGPIGSTSTSTGAFSSISTPSATIGGGTINATTIGATSASTGAFTTLGASGNDALFYQTTNAQSFTSGTPANVTTWTKVFDRVNANFNASTGVFTAPATGFYFVTAQLAFSANTGAVNTRGQISIVANGVTVAVGPYTRQTATSTEMTPQISALVNLTAGQTLVVQGNQNTGGAVTLDGSAQFNYLSIVRIP